MKGFKPNQLWTYLAGTNTITYYNTSKVTGHHYDPQQSFPRL